MANNPNTNQYGNQKQTPQDIEREDSLGSGGNRQSGRMNNEQQGNFGQSRPENQKR